MDLMQLSRIIEQSRDELEQSDKDVAVMFIDLADSTACKEQLGIPLGLDKILTFIRDATKIINAVGEDFKKNNAGTEYTVCKYIGDEIMAYFSGNNAATVAIRTGMLIQQFFWRKSEGMKLAIAKFKPKIGIDWGRVSFAKYSTHLPEDPYGLIVDRAARITSIAKPQQILVSEDALRQVEILEDGQFGEPADRLFKGISEKARIRELIWRNEAFGIKPEEEPSLTLIAADSISVDQYFRDENLLAISTQIDFFLYTSETIITFLRHDLSRLRNTLRFRILIRNPQTEETRVNQTNIKSEIGKISQLMSTYPLIRFEVRFYDEVPCLRLYIFPQASGY